MSESVKNFFKEVGKLLKYLIINIPLFLLVMRCHEYIVASFERSLALDIIVLSCALIGSFSFVYDAQKVRKPLLLSIFLAIIFSFTVFGFYKFVMMFN